MTQITIELPDKLLEANPQESLARLIDEALQVKRTPKAPSKLLELAGIVTEAPRGAADHAEDFEN